MYDPSVGRWLSVDPLGFDAKDVNLYRYVRNSPVTATDPTGLLDNKFVVESDVIYAKKGRYPYLEVVGQEQAKDGSVKFKWKRRVKELELSPNQPVGITSFPRITAGAIVEPSLKDPGKCVLRCAMGGLLVTQIWPVDETQNEVWESIRNFKYEPANSRPVPLKQNYVYMHENDHYMTSIDAYESIRVGLNQIEKLEFPDTAAALAVAGRMVREVNRVWKAALDYSETFDKDPHWKGGQYVDRRLPKEAHFDLKRVVSPKGEDK